MMVNSRMISSKHLKEIVNQVALTSIGKLFSENQRYIDAVETLTIGGLLRLATCPQSRLSNCSPEDTDVISGLDGLGRILAEKGYLLFDSVLYSCKVNKFHLFGIELDDPEKERKRELVAQRQARYRLNKKSQRYVDASTVYVDAGNIDVVNDKPKVNRRRRHEYTPEFEAFWAFAVEQYGKVGSAPGNKREAFTSFQGSDPSHENIERWTDALGAQARAKAKQGARALSFKHVARWLKYECWADVIQLPTRDTASARLGGFDQVDYTTGLEHFS